MSRGMNAAAAIHGDYAYIGSRTDGGHEDMPHGGIMVVDISDPSDPKLAPSTENGPLDAAPGESSRELRVWRSQDILIVLNTNCGVGELLHHCTLPSISNFRFYDISGANASNPQLIRQFDADTHEFFLWEDPNNPARALHFRGQRQFHMRDPRWLSQLPVLGVGHLQREGSGHDEAARRDPLQRTAPLQAVPGRAGTRPDSDGRFALALRQQRRDQGVLRAADRRLRGRRHV